MSRAFPGSDWTEYTKWTIVTSNHRKWKRATSTRWKEGTCASDRLRNDEVNARSPSNWSSWSSRAKGLLRGNPWSLLFYGMGVFVYFVAIRAQRAKGVCMASSMKPYRQRIFYFAERSPTEWWMGASPQTPFARCARMAMVLILHDINDTRRRDIASMHPSGFLINSFYLHISRPNGLPVTDDDLRD